MSDHEPTVPVTCDACGEGFDAQIVAREEKGGETQAFTCPHCNHEYVTARITGRGVRLRAELQTLRQEGRYHTRAYRRLEKRYQREVIT